jgi:hypothetical protein
MAGGKATAPLAALIVDRAGVAVDSASGLAAENRLSDM